MLLSMKSRSFAKSAALAAQRFPWHTRPNQHVCWSCLATINSHRVSRNYSTETPRAGSSSSSRSTSRSSSSSIFSSNNDSSWDDLFSSIDSQVPPSRLSPAARSSRRQTMTAREVKAFDEMFNMIFDAVSEKKAAEAAGAESDPASSRMDDVAIGRGDMGDLFGKLRRHSKSVRWTSELDVLLDRKKEDMNLCLTDSALLDWAVNEVFGEGITREEDRRKSMAATTDTATQTDDSSAESQPTSAQTPESPIPPPLQSPAYPHLIAHLMRTFRDKYQDPNLALAVFEHAKTLSIASYVFGCTTPVYNELLEIRWNWFGDLKGVHDALVEMKVNGVGVDSKTRKVVDEIRRGIRQQQALWVDEIDVQAEAASLPGTGNDAWSMLARIESLVKPEPKKRGKMAAKPKSQKPKWDDWKTMGLEDDEGDEWGFDRWDTPKASFASSASTARRTSSAGA